MNEKILVERLSHVLLIWSFNIFFVAQIASFLEDNNTFDGGQRAIFSLADMSSVPFQRNINFKEWLMIYCMLKGDSFLIFHISEYKYKVDKNIKKREEKNESILISCRFE
jgi:hypothetical protein